ncbi:signal transduction histidine kinase [Bradyrhizobium japonicum]|jgi:signal transduction histidine kinase|uniref:sensor histidine kinase n=1 Tax=Bradyrhizobium TaxID=374 RepID=UPI0004051A26|nr:MULTISPECIES: ATP-binding protein [Bradyrhizobium]MBR0877495.1 sensor histidine kinase [Bradyrhizobium liaoningense]MBR0943730.1 sensor histidine kinase [Bradyrhizobium liaoningense]MBR0996861.1 sensor histidine kinase [Bradyrhizobium liaoningense]MBR1063423.1 sensor histidine kinase [Bradyrhizobium liaoningense]MCP1745983.1 signal transduction histidine kinase [Bradyrhizobium japonicum]
MRIITGLARILIIFLFASLSRECIAADGPQQRSILVLEEADFRSPFYSEIFAGIRAAAKQSGTTQTVIYGESLDLARFPGPDYEESLVGHLKTKYAHRPIDVIVSIGVASAKFLQKRKQDIWPAPPVVYGFVPDLPETRALFLPNTTAIFARVRPAHLLTAARAIVPDLTRVVLVGDAWKNPLVYGHWKQDFAAAMPDLEVTDLSDAVLRDVRKHVASLPARSAILTSAMYSDGEGTYYSPVSALARVAEHANRPIVITSDTFLGRAGVGGFLLLPETIGREAGEVAMRILDGEAPSRIPPFAGDNVKPIFDWRQLKRWNVDEANLPAGSEVRFRQPSFWEQYYWHSTIVASVVLVQALMIAVLLRERRLRFLAEVEARQRMSELAHMNRRATAGEMTASIAHELNQPLAAILINAETAQQVLRNPAPDLGEVTNILDHIRRDDQRAAEVIGRLRSFLRRDPTERHELDLNATVGEVFRFLSVQALTHDVELTTEPSSANIRVKADKIQLQQAILNLVVNAMDAVAHLPDDRRRVVGRTSLSDGNLAIVSIVDTGDGIMAEKVSEIFQPFFTTKAQGMGIGLSIAHTIVAAHGGRIWAENAPSGGAVFHVSLPLAAPR